VVVSNGDELVSSVKMEGAVINVPSLSGDTNAVCVDEPLQVASSVDGVELSRVEGVPLDAECGVDTASE